MARMMGRLLLLAILLASSVGSAAADTKKERTAILAVELGKGVHEFVRAKATAQVQQGLIAAGYEVVPPEETAKQLPADLATCKSGPCLAQVGKALQASSLVHVSITRKLDSQIIVMRMLDPNTGDALADIHEVCDLCGQDELEERIGVAASALRSKAVAALAKRAAAMPASPVRVAEVPAGPLRVAIIPGIAVNLDTARVDALSQELADALMAELDIVALGGLEVRRQLPPDGVPPDCVTTPACTADVARRTGASQLLFVVMVDSGAGGSVQVDTTWIDPGNSLSASRPAIDLTSQTEAKAKFTSAARQLLPDAPVRAKQDSSTSGVTPSMTDGVPRHFSTPAKITAAVAGVGLGAGIAFGLATRSRYNSCDAMPIDCTDSKKDSIRTFGILADSGYVIAAGAAIATLVLYVTSAEEPRLIVSPTPDGAAVSAFGRF
jgi:hypothetical protein